LLNIFQEAFGLSVEDMSDMMTSELLNGCVDDPSVKAGFIGEIGCCYPMNGIHFSFTFFIIPEIIDRAVLNKKVS
jgi:hypothetical protein